MDDLGLEEAIDRLGKRIVVESADTADRRLNAGFGQAFGVSDKASIMKPTQVAA